MEAEVDRQKILLIIGTNVPEVFISLEVRHGDPDDPIAIRYVLALPFLEELGLSKCVRVTMFTWHQWTLQVDLCRGQACWKDNQLHDLQERWSLLHGPPLEAW